ncbi:MAG TPA: EAL domain-containing protein [Kineosporiaceae bacterium]|nr:EAL domain-containing protein [Kineosporiaceae bacterium]
MPEPAIRQLISDNADGILVVHPGGVVLFANAAASRLLRPQGSPLVGTEFGHPAVAGEVTEIDLPATGRVAEMRVSTINWEGAPARLASLREITERRLAERSRQQLAAIVEASGDAIIGLDAQGNIETWNAGAEQLYGYTRSEMLGRPVLTLAAPDTVTARRTALHRLLDTGRGEQVETRDRRRDGSLVEVSVTSSPIRDVGGRVVGMACVARDIGEQKRVERELTFLADHDPLTGLLNRRRLSNELAHQCALAARYGDASALLLGDIDRFKEVNDSWGHQAGDEVIRRVADAITERLRDTDVAARLGGDEFAVLLPRTDRAGAQRAAESLCQSVEAVDVPFADGRIKVRISFGIAILEGQAISPEQALATADLAMYEAKREGNRRVVALDTGLGPEHIAEDLAVTGQLHSALAEQRFELHAQPVVHLATGAVSQFELLLRLHQDGQLLLPEAFLGAAERSDVIRDLDRWVVERALDLTDRRGDDGPTFTVNLSAAAIGDGDLLDLISHGIRDRGLAPGALNVELRESAAVGQLEATRHFVEGLHRARCSVSLDDFGSGLGSFHELRYLPVDSLKIDGGLVHRMPHSTVDQLVVKAIADVARGLGQQMVAKHVDSDRALALLREYGVEYGQGFRLGRPRPLEVPDRTSDPD